MTLAGLPPARVNGGTSLVTTELAAIMAPSPIVTPAMMVEPVPTHAPFFTMMSPT